jgi:DNA-binding MarR family transcriptional regulator
LAAHGIDEGQLDVLEALVAVGQPFRLTAGEVTRACGVTPGATSQRLTVMERSGLVERVREEPDRRTVHVQLTDTGRARVDEVADDVRAADASAVQGLRPDELAALDRALAAWTVAWDVMGTGSRDRSQRGRRA